MTRRNPTLLAAALVLALTGCTDNTPTPGEGTPTTASASPSSGPSTSSAPASSTPTPSASSTLTAAEQEAFDDATDAVVAFNQTWVDLYTGARTNLNDLDLVLAEGDLLDGSLKKAQQDLVAGAYATPKGAQIALVSSEPVSIKLSKKPPTVKLEACIDTTAVTTYEKKGADPAPGVREEVTYTVVQTTYLPAPGWAVQKMEGPADPEKRRC